MSHAIISVLALVVLLLPPSLASRGLTVQDMIKIHRLGSPTLSPDNDHYVYTETVYRDNSDASDVYLMYASLSGNGEASRICEFKGTGKGNPTFLDENILVFTGASEIEGDNTQQAWYVDLRNGVDDCHQFTSYPLSIDNLIFARSAEGDHFLFSTEVYYGTDMEGTIQRDAEKAATGAEFHLFTDGYIRHWDTWYEQDKWQHTFSTEINIDLENGTISIDDGVSPVDISKTVMGDVPMRPDGDRSQLSVSPDGTRIAYITQDTNPENKPGMTNPSSRQFTTNDALYIVDVKGTEKPECITCDPKTYIYSEARAGYPQWLEDNEIYFLGMKEFQSESDKVRLVKCELKSNNSVSGTNTFTFLTEDYDFGIGSFTRDLNDKNVFWLIVLQYARERLIRFDVSKTLEEGYVIPSYNPPSNERYTICTYNGSVGSPSQTGNGKILLSYNSYTSPAEVAYINEADINNEGGAEIHVLTNIKQQLLDQDICMQEAHDVDIGEEGDRVHNFYFVPCGFDIDNPPEEKPPIIVYVHGGPESPWSDDWSYRWNPQAMLAHGYSMILTNFHGSDSFGDKFTKSIRQNWYTTPFNDVKNGLKYMIEHGLGDTNNIGAMGASYGGTFMNWLNGHNDETTPFVESWTKDGVTYPDLIVKVIITHDGIFDLRHFGYDTDETFFPAREFDGYPENEIIRQYYERDNPANYSMNWKTPTLVVQGGCDYRIFVNHGISTFQTLRMLGVPAKLMYFPTQSHWVYSTQESVVWHTNVLEWLDQYINPGYVPPDDN